MARKGPKAAGVLEWVSLGGSNITRDGDKIGGNGHLYTYRYDAMGDQIDQESLDIPNADSIIVDSGTMFADPVATGYSNVLPDSPRFYQDAKAIVFTHGHMDHIGALAHHILYMKQHGIEAQVPPVYGSPFTIELIRNQFAQMAGAFKKAGIAEEDLPELHEMQPGDRLKFGQIEVEPIPGSHSISQMMQLKIKTPAGTVIHSGDIKADQSVMIGPPTDFTRLREIAAEGVDALLLDSTRAQAPGETPSLAEVRASHLKMIEDHPDQRMVFAVMGTSVEEIAGIVEGAAKTGRTVIVHGASVMTNLKALERAGIDMKELVGGAVRILDAKTKTAQRLQEEHPEQVVVLATGTQGEETAALPRAAAGEHKTLKLSENDCVVVAATPIPGNEAASLAMYEAVRSSGADLITYKDGLVHASGHGHKEDLKQIIQAANPRTLIPMHGGTDHLEANAAIGRECGVGTLDASNGDIVRFTTEGAKTVGRIEDLTYIGVKEKMTVPGQFWSRSFSYDAGVTSMTGAAPEPTAAAPQARPRQAPRLSA